ncbi:MAG: TetR/AcrR family transcriptional regulator [Gammaproteobacteria bacterium]|nr:TetR/AcrR family transcriptional regulator [Gammaproteobacteria bacterium]
MPDHAGTERQRARRDRILQATRELVTSVGYEGLTMRELAARAQVSPTTLYNLYTNKDELLFAAVGDHMSGSLQEARALAPDPGYEQLVRIVEVLGVQVQATPEYAEAIAKALFQAGPEDALTRLLVLRTSQQCLPSLQAMADAGQLRPGVKHDRTAHLLVDASWGCMFGWLKGMVPLADLRRELRDLRLSILMSVAEGEARRHMEEWLDSEPENLRPRRRSRA